MNQLEAIVLEWLFPANVVAHLVLLAGAVWCIAFPNRRVYPMQKKSLMFYYMWALFYFIFLTPPLFIYFDWNSGIWSEWTRLIIGLPLLVLGNAFLLWGINNLGAKNTSGIKDGFVDTGPYRFSRNPQYVGDFALFLGIIIISNSGVVLITHLLTVLVFLIAPLAEESWLEEQYGTVYKDYCSRVSRFL